MSFSPRCNHVMPKKTLCLTAFLPKRYMASQTQDPILDIQTKYEEFQRSCKTILPKIDLKLIEDFLNRQHEDPGAKYSIGVTTKEGLDTPLQQK